MMIINESDSEDDTTTATIHKMKTKDENASSTTTTSTATTTTNSALPSNEMIKKTCHKLMSTLDLDSITEKKLRVLVANKLSIPADQQTGLLNNHTLNDQYIPAIKQAINEYSNDTNNNDGDNDNEDSMMSSDTEQRDQEEEEEEEDDSNDDDDDGIIDRHIQPTSKKTKTTSTESKPKGIKKTKSNETKTKGSNSSKLEHSIQLAKSYIAKCGIRKVWKREFANLSQAQCLERCKAILRDEAGITEGRPSIARCKEAKRRREEQEALAAVQGNVILTQRLRR